LIMEKFNTIISTAVPLAVENIDTDQIIPARFLKAVDRSGFGENLFRDWRYDQAGVPKTDFILNDPVYSGKILLAGKNFGSGSSREHAAWALYDYGFRVVISSFFADIFKSNSLNNGLLVTEVPEEYLAELFDTVDSEPAAQIKVDLEEQTITNNNTGKSVGFQINSYKKKCLLQGYDDIDYLLSIRDEIGEFEKKG